MASLFFWFLQARLVVLTSNSDLQKPKYGCGELVYRFLPASMGPNPILEIRKNSITAVTSALRHRTGLRPRIKHRFHRSRTAAQQHHAAPVLSRSRSESAACKNHGQRSGKQSGFPATSDAYWNSTRLKKRENLTRDVTSKVTNQLKQNETGPEKLNHCVRINGE